MHSSTFAVENDIKLLGASINVYSVRGDWARINNSLPQRWVHRDHIQQVFSASGTRVVNVGTGNTLNMRSAPTTNGTIRGSLRNNASITVRARANGWYLLTTTSAGNHGVVGLLNRSMTWVNASHVRR